MPVAVIGVVTVYDKHGFEDTPGGFLVPYRSYQSSQLQIAASWPRMKSVIVHTGATAISLGPQVIWSVGRVAWSMYTDVGVGVGAQPHVL